MASTRFRRGAELVTIPIALLLVGLCIMNGQNVGGGDANYTSVAVPRDDVVSMQDERLKSGETYELPHDVETASRTILEQYENAGESVVVRSGYLDLYGKTWSCVLQGPGWVDLCVVSERGDQERRSTVQRVRLDAEDWRKEYDK